MAIISSSIEESYCAEGDKGTGLISIQIEVKKVILMFYGPLEILR